MKAKGLGQNYQWDRYPGEYFPDVPAHTMSVGLAGTWPPAGVWPPANIQDPHMPPGSGPLGPQGGGTTYPQCSPPCPVGFGQSSDGSDLPVVNTPIPGDGTDATTSTLTPLPGAINQTATPAATATGTSSTNTGMLVVGVLALAAGIGGIAYLAHRKSVGG